MSLVRLLAYLMRVSTGTRRSRLAFAGVVAAGVGSGLALAGLVATVNALIAGEGRTRGALVWAFAGFLVLRPVLRLAAQYLVVRLTERGFVTLRLDLCRRILGTPLHRLEGHGRGALTATLTSDVGQIVTAMALVPTLLMHASVVVGFLVYLGWLYWPLLPPLFGLTVVGGLMIRWLIARGVQKVAAGRKMYDRLSHQFRGVTEGTKELQLHARRRAAFMAEMETTARAHRRELRTSEMYFGAMSAFSELLFFMAVGGILLLAPGVADISPATLASYVLAVLMLRAPLEGTLDGAAALGQAAVAVRKVEEMAGSLGSVPADPPAGMQLLPGSGWSSLELAGVTHAYRGEADERFVLGPVNLSFRPGELVFVVGGNGSGKTTLAKVLLGLYIPDQGELRLDGRAMGAADLQRWREHFSAVFADFFLFESLLGADLLNVDDSARHYLTALHLDHKVRVSGGVLSTVDLSQGQRKRLALLGAYLEDRPICLFDEWAADQDPHFKEVFYRRLLPELRARGKTLVVISHDDQYYDVADRIVHLDYGQVSFDGPAGEYLARPAAGMRALAV